MSKYVYLAGPIDGCTEDAAKGWRQYVKEQFNTKCIIGISPLRCEPAVTGKYSGVYADPKFGTARAIYNKNWLDMVACDLTLAYMPSREDDTISFGTMLEIGWAQALRKPLIVVSNNKKLTEHPDIAGSQCWILETLDEGIRLINGIYTDYV